MRFTPRAEEITRVVDIMERDFPTGEAMAKAIIAEVADMFHFRPWYAIAAAGQNLAWGPWASEADAASARQKYLGILIPGDPSLSGVVLLHPVYGMDVRDGGGFGFCVQEGCGHPPYAHAAAGSARGHCVICKNAGYKCAKYKDQKAVKKRATPKKQEATA